MRNILFRKKEATGIENMLVSMISLVMVCAFLVIVFGAFSSINDKWSMRQAARETLLIMETEGYLKPEDEQALITELTGYGLYDINLTGTTKTEVDYGDHGVLKNNLMHLCMVCPAIIRMRRHIRSWEPVRRIVKVRMRHITKWQQKQMN